MAAWLFCVTSAHAVTLLRDPDIEHGLEVLSRPILIAAGLDPEEMRILVVDEPSMNAFVIDGGAIYLHRGLILKLESAAQLQTVIAHEAAHIAHNHFARRMMNAQGATRISGIGLALAAAAAIGGAPAGAAAGIAAGSSSAAQRTFFAYTRAEEGTADRSALRYMQSADIPTQGAVELMDIFREQDALSISRQDPYTRSHPEIQDRWRRIQGFAATHPGPEEPLAEHAYWFARLSAKLSAFTRSPDWVLRHSQEETEIGTMTAAIAQHRLPSPREAIALANELVLAYPKDPYYLELQGQILRENLKIDEAVDAYARAVELAPSNALILGGYGKALLAQDTPASNRRALEVLDTARTMDFQSGSILRALGQAYARAGQPAMASLVTAERFALRGEIQNAVLHAERALAQLPEGSPQHQRAQDILHHKS